MKKLVLVLTAAALTFTSCKKENADDLKGNYKLETVDFFVNGKKSGDGYNHNGNDSDRYFYTLFTSDNLIYSVSTLKNGQQPRLLEQKVPFTRNGKTIKVNPGFLEALTNPTVTIKGDKVTFREITTSEGGKQEAVFTYVKSKFDVLKTINEMPK